MRSFLVSLGLAVLAFDLSLFLSPEKGGVANYLYNLAYALIYLTAAIFAFVKSKKVEGSPDLKKSMLSFSIGMLTFTFGLIIWTIYNIFLKIPIPYPSSADIFFLIFYPAVIAGVYYLIRSLDAKITPALLLEGLLIFVVFFGILYIFLNQTATGADIPFLAKILNILYPFFDSLLISFAITILRTEKGVSSHPYILFFVFSFFAMATADTIFSFRSSAGTYWNGDVSDLLFTISGLLAAFGFLSVPNVGLTKEV